MRYALVLPTRARNFKVFTLIGKQRLVTLASVAALLVVAALAAVAQTPRPAGPSKDAGGASAFRAQTTVPVSPLAPPLCCCCLPWITTLAESGLYPRRSRI
jgi:hypothetical protein